MAVLQLSIILYYDTLKILKSGLDRGPIIDYHDTGTDIYYLLGIGEWCRMVYI